MYCPVESFSAHIAIQSGPPNLCPFPNESLTSLPSISLLSFRSATCRRSNLTSTREAVQLLSVVLTLRLALCQYSVRGFFYTISI